MLLGGAMTLRTKIIIGLLVVGIGALLALQTPLLASARRASWRIATSTTGALFGIGSLALDNDVAEQLDRLTAENHRLRAELHDYHTLREQLGSPALESRRFIPALLSPQPLNVWRSELLLNRGVADGVTPGAPVVVHGSILVGFVSELSNHTATARLLIHPESSLPAEIQADEPIRGLLGGVTHTTMHLTTIPRDKEVSLGQPVVTAGNDSVPTGLLVGHIDAITAEENEAYQSAQLALPYAAEDLRAVTIVVEP